MENIETVIDRVRTAIYLGMSPEQIVTHFDEVPNDILYLAYKAAVILDSDEDEVIS